MIFLPELTLRSELEKSLIDPTHLARCQINSNLYHIQCHYCGKIIHLTSRTIKHLLHDNKHFRPLCGSACKTEYYVSIYMKNTTKRMYRRRMKILNTKHHPIAAILKEIMPDQ